MNTPHKKKPVRYRTMVVNGKTVPVIIWSVNITGPDGKRYTCGPWDLALTHRVQKSRATRTVAITFFEQPTPMIASDVS